MKFWMHSASLIVLSQRMRPIPQKRLDVILFKAATWLGMVGRYG